MDEFKRKLIHLHHCRGIGWKSIFDILKNDPQLKSFYHLTPSKHFPLSTESNKQFFEDLHSVYIHEQIRHYGNNNIHTITLFDKEYPNILRETYQPPWVLYASGNLKILNQNPKLAVVGSRQSTEYGRNAIEKIIPSLIEKGIVIVSGLASGIDTIAHKSTIKYGGKTIGVIAGGFYHIYPQTNRELATEMMQNHLLLSEYPPNIKPTRWQFPMRNRIISGISHGTFIIEAKKKSGSLITANYAVNEGREVFALPGSIFSHCSTGANELIQQGAKLVNNAVDILEELLN